MANIRLTKHVALLCSDGTRYPNIAIWSAEISGQGGEDACPSALIWLDGRAAVLPTDKEAVYSLNIDGWNFVQGSVTHWVTKDDWLCIVIGTPAALFDLGSTSKWVSPDKWEAA